METYGEIIFLLSFAGIFISIISFALCAICKRTKKYAWIFGCIAGFCFFNAFRYVIILSGADDITDPTYEVYKNWNIYHFILSDIIHFFIWLGIGILYYFTFIKRNKLLKCLFILGASVFLIFMVLSVVLFSTTSMQYALNNSSLSTIQKSCCPVKASAFFFRFLLCLLIYIKILCELKWFMF